MIALLIAGTVIAGLLALLGLAGTFFGVMLFDASHRGPRPAAVYGVLGSMFAITLSAGVGIWLAWANWNDGANPAAAAWQLLPLGFLIISVLIVRAVAGERSAGKQADKASESTANAD